MNGLQWMVVGQVYDERVRYEPEHQPGHQPDLDARRTYDFERYPQAWGSPRRRVLT
jgi:hypothetical protein